MARTPIAINDAPLSYDLAGKAITYTAGDAVNNHEFVATGTEILLVRNGSGGAILVTVKSQPLNNRSGDQVLSVAAGAEAVFGPFPTTGWATGGKINVDIASATSLTLAVIRLPRY
jgi:hypothetical protein